MTRTSITFLFHLLEGLNTKGYIQDGTYKNQTALVSQQPHFVLLWLP